MGKNKDKKNKGTDAAADLGFAKPSEASVGDIDDWKLTKPEHIGKLFLFTPLREEKVTTKMFGEKPAIIADVVMVDEKDPAKSELHSDVYIFSGYLRGSLKSFVGKRKVLGRLAQREDQKYKNPSWQLDDASQSDIDLAHAYQKSIDPFEQS